MALERLHLRKLLKILFLDARKMRSAIRADIREERIRDERAREGTRSSGGDFYGPFWADAKLHVFGISDLHERVDERIARNRKRQNLYPQLRDGFLLWWNERRRWTNEPFAPGPSMKIRFPFPEVNAVVKIDSIMSVQDGAGAERFIYPYFAPEPVLSEEAARLGLWLLTAALREVPRNSIRILDVIRGRTFSLDRLPLNGDEEQEFRRRFIELLRQRDELRMEER